jgi:hypothetical protein
VTGGRGKGEGEGRGGTGQRDTSMDCTHNRPTTSTNDTNVCIHTRHTAVGLRWLPTREPKANFYVEWRLKFGICYERALSNKTQALEFIAR